MSVHTPAQGSVEEDAMPSLLHLRPAAALAAHLGRAETAARIAMAGLVDDPQPARRPPGGPYGAMVSGLALCCAAIGIALLFGQA